MPVATALLPGTFDPITLGHLDVLRRGRPLFSKVIVAIGVRHDKRTLFSIDERVAMARAATAELDGVTIEPFEGLLANFARAQGAQFLLRGVRNAMDFEYEAQMAHANRHLLPGLETVALVADPTLSHISSSLVKEVHAAGGDVASFVPDVAVVALNAKRG